MAGSEALLEVTEWAQMDCVESQGQQDYSKDRGEKATARSCIRSSPMDTLRDASQCLHPGRQVPFNVSKTEARGVSMNHHIYAVIEEESHHTDHAGLKVNDKTNDDNGSGLNMHNPRLEEMYALKAQMDRLAYERESLVVRGKDQEGRKSDSDTIWEHLIGLIACASTCSDKGFTVDDSTSSFAHLTKLLQFATQNRSPKYQPPNKQQMGRCSKGGGRAQSGQREVEGGSCGEKSQARRMTGKRNAVERCGEIYDMMSRSKKREQEQDRTLDALGAISKDLVRKMEEVRQNCGREHEQERLGDSEKHSPRRRGVTTLATATTTTSTFHNCNNPTKANENNGDSSHVPASPAAQSWVVFSCTFRHPCLTAEQASWQHSHSVPWPGGASNVIPTGTARQAMTMSAATCPESCAIVDGHSQPAEEPGFVPGQVSNLTTKGGMKESEKTKRGVEHDMELDTPSMRPLSLLRRSEGLVNGVGPSRSRNHQSLRYGLSKISSELRRRSDGSETTTGSRTEGGWTEAIWDGHR
ncbi:hypothetical protein BKA70DRAFT_1242037 [Coprinopsis sp. MPI-PUGE-AT-0042]|nr:hypothetical protein BKA70DRAFT_1242037 [Coprinopsis sp. MPI-PUGE-AT-0042]